MMFSSFFVICDIVPLCTIALCGRVFPNIIGKEQRNLQNGEWKLPEFLDILFLTIEK